MSLGQWLGLFCIIAALYILWQIRQILLLAFTAVVLAIALNILVRKLTRLGLPRGTAVLLTVLTSLLASILFFWLIVPPFADQFQKVIELLPSGFLRIRDWADDLRTRLPTWVPDLPTLSNLQQQLQPSFVSLFGNFFAVFQNTLVIFVQALLVFILAIMLLANPDSYRQAFLILFPSFYRRRADEVVEACEVALRNWLMGILVSSLFVALISGVGLLVLQVRLVFAHALLAGLLHLIPNIGPTLSVVFPASVALLDAPWKAGAVIALYLVIQQIESYWLTPTVMAHQVSLLPALTLICQIVFASFFDFLGLLMALPLTVVAKTWIQEVLIKDILDCWQSDRERSPRLETVTVLPAPEAVEALPPNRHDPAAPSPDTSDPQGKP